MSITPKVYQKDYTKIKIICPVCKKEGLKVSYKRHLRSQYHQKRLNNPIKVIKKIQSTTVSFD